MAVHADRVLGLGHTLLSHEPVQTWDVRAAVCAVGVRNMEAQSDEALVFLLRSSVDQQAANDLFGELFRRYQARVTQWCHRIIREPDSIPDLVQEVFLRAFKRLPTYRGNSKFSTWLFVITRNHCLNALKKRQIEPVEDGERMPDDLPGTNGQEIHLAMERDQHFRTMWRLIEATLTPAEVRVLALHYGHGLPLAVITRQMLLSNPSGAKAYIVNARRKLKGVLSTAGFASESEANQHRRARHVCAAAS